MRTPDGYTLSYRSKWEHPVFKSKQEAAVWAWMCDIAQWRDTRISTKFGPVELLRGELIIAERELSEDFGLYRNALRSLLHRMVADGMITLKQDHKMKRLGTIVRVVKYEQYQCFDVVSNDDLDRKPTANWTESGPQMDRKWTKNNTVNQVNAEEEREVGDKERILDKGKCLGEASVSPVAKPDKATRLPNDWVLPLEWGNWAVSEGLTVEAVRREADKFRDFWIAKPGAGGRKLDWSATWRNWIRNSNDRGMGNGRQKSNRGSGSGFFDYGCALAAEGSAG